MGRGAGTQALALDLGSIPFISHVTVDTLNQVKEPFLLQKWELYPFQMTVVRIKEYFLLFFRAGHTVISRSHKKYKPMCRGQMIGREPERYGVYCVSFSWLWYQRKWRHVFLASNNQRRCN